MIITENFINLEDEFTQMLKTLHSKKHCIFVKSTYEQIQLNFISEVNFS